MEVVQRNILLILWFALLPALHVKAQQSLESRPWVAAREIRLAAPKVEVDSVIFRQQARISASTGLPDGHIYYQNMEQASDVSLHFAPPLILDRSGAWAFWSEHPEYQTSDTVIVSVVKVRAVQPAMSVALKTAPHPNYRGTGAPGLTDLRKGTANFRKGNHWLGFQQEEVLLTLTFTMATPLSTVKIGLLQDANSWILLPGQIQVNDRGNTLAKLRLPPALEGVKTSSLFQEIPLEPGLYTQLEISIKPQQLPPWHPGAGGLAWIFIDEIIVE